MEIKYFQYTYIVQDLYLEYIKDSQKLIRKQNNPIKSKIIKKILYKRRYTNEKLSKEKHTQYY